MMVGLLEELEEFELAVEALFLDWLLTKGMLLIILIWGMLLLPLVDDDVEGKDLLVLEAGTALTALTALTAWDLWLEEATVADLTAESVGWWLLVPSDRLFETE